MVGSPIPEIFSFFLLFLPENKMHRSSRNQRIPIEPSISRLSYPILSHPVQFKPNRPNPVLFPPKLTSCSQLPSYPESKSKSKLNIRYIRPLLITTINSLTLDHRLDFSFPSTIPRRHFRFRNGTASITIIIPSRRRLAFPSFRDHLAEASMFRMRLVVVVLGCAQGFQFIGDGSLDDLQDVGFGEFVVAAAVPDAD